MLHLRGGAIEKPFKPAQKKDEVRASPNMGERERGVREREREVACGIYWPRHLLRQGVRRERERERERRGITYESHIGWPPYKR